MWLCEECRSGAGPNRQVEVHNEAAVDHNITSDSTNQLSSPLVEDASSPVSMDTSPVEKQELPDLNLVPSDSDSAN
ncbi:unnamed protein product [Arabis nemorensis]|uniref:Uncharacterized protein n=1 Tax=Arabis nemorensis TaxID=586526 RepID=A0A565CVJ1_9BRAS|nr:unnamed protein product [Arabis nemorensis]